MSGGETDLAVLLRSIEPRLSDQRFAFEPAYDSSLTDDLFALIREAEGVTAVRERSDGVWARISLGVNSSLDAVGLSAVLSRALADCRISANIVAGLHHDHIFVPWDRRVEALAVVEALAD